MTEWRSDVGCDWMPYFKVSYCCWIVFNVDNCQSSKTVSFLCTEKMICYPGDAYSFFLGLKHPCLDWKPELCTLLDRKGRDWNLWLLQWQPGVLHHWATTPCTFSLILRYFNSVPVYIVHLSRLLVTYWPVWEGGGGGGGGCFLWKGDRRRRHLL